MSIGDLLIKIGLVLGGRIEPLPSDFPSYRMRFSEMITELEALGLEWQLKSKYKGDYWIYYTDERSWKTIIPYLILPANLYVEERADCDDYSRWASAKSAIDFKFNGCRQCWGNIPLGRHAFNLVIIHRPHGEYQRDYMLFENNSGFPFAGKLFKFGENGYVPKSWR